jgi:hypothetical protein
LTHSTQKWNIDIPLHFLSISDDPPPQVPFLPSFFSSPLFPKTGYVVYQLLNSNQWDVFILCCSTCPVLQGASNAPHVASLQVTYPVLPIVWREK